MIAHLSEVDSGVSRDLNGTPTPQKIRVLHVVENLDKQAVETWLLRVLRVASQDYPQFHWTFFCVFGKEGRLDEEARSLGAEVIHSQYEIGDKVHFIHALRKVMNAGHYDILHCHHDIMSALYLAASAGLPFRKRIVHVHNTSLHLPTPNRMKADLVRRPMREVCLRMADRIVGISQDALVSMVGKHVNGAGRFTVLHYAVDTAKFAPAQGRAELRLQLRRDLQLQPDARILLFVGRMVDYKNPCLLVEILAELLKAEPAAVAVFAGTGELESSVQELAQCHSLAANVRVLGFRDDVPRLMLGSDVLIWPSVEEPKEGLGLGIIEAQSAGLPVVMSRSVPDEAIVVPELVKVLSLAEGAKVWADAALQLLQNPPGDREKSRKAVEASSFSMRQGVKNMMSLYEL
jgi:glycosyltransferase involved in cell wall biosynthesis